MPKTISRSLAADRPLLVDITAPAAHVHITAVRGLSEARLEASGPPEVIKGLQTRQEAGRLEIRLPKSGPAATTRQRTNVFNGTVVSGGIHVVGGDVVINGNRVTADSDPVRLTLQVPATSSVRSRVEAGQVRCQGPLTDVEHRSKAAELELDQVERVVASTVSGDVRAALVAVAADVSSTSGDIDLDQAMGPVQARTISGDITTAGQAAMQADSTSGDIRLHATDSVRVRAHAISGDVTVSHTRGARPLIDATSTSGRVRSPAAA